MTNTDNHAPSPPVTASTPKMRLAIKLTKSAVDKLTATEDTTFWCPELPGFGLRVLPSGRKTYVLRFRLKTGEPGKLKISRACDMPPEKARELARAAFQRIAAGEDPRKITRSPEVVTLAAFADKYQAQYADLHKKANSARQDRYRWDKYILPSLGVYTDIKAITKDHITAFQAKHKATPGVANVCIVLLSKAMNLAEDWKLRPENSNPCRKVRRLKLKKHDLFLKPQQIAALDQALRDMVAERAIPAQFDRFIRLLLLTGCRKSEILTARTEWLDEQLLKLPDSKTGPKDVALSKLALSLAANDSEWVIPGIGTKKPLEAVYRIWKRVKARAGLPANLRFHDLRHTTGTLALASGLSIKQVADQLGHADLQTTGIYIHAVDEGLEAANVITDIIEKAWRTQ